MPADFSTLVRDARSFLGELADNNTKEWFTENKPKYEANLKSPALALLDIASEDIAALAGHKPTTKLFRPHRDVRFSKDKTPYHIHLHMLWTTPGTPQDIGWFFGIGLEYISIGAGIMGFDKSGVDAFRRTIDADAGKSLVQEITALTSDGMRLAEPELKRVPAPYDKDHKHADMLKRKSLTIWQDFDEAQFRDPTKHLQETFARLAPLCAKLSTLNHA